MPQDRFVLPNSLSYSRSRSSISLTKAARTSRCQTALCPGIYRQGVTTPVTGHRLGGDIHHRAGDFLDVAQTRRHLPPALTGVLPEALDQVLTGDAIDGRVSYELTFDLHFDLLYRRASLRRRHPPWMCT